MPKEETQLELIDVTPENAKRIKTLVRKRTKLHDDHIKLKQDADAVDVELLEEIKKAGGKPDVNGVIRVKVGDAIMVVKPGKARLTIKEENEEDQEETPEAEDEFDAAGGGEQPALATRRRTRTQGE